ncbi:MAG: hypothetical protein OHK93_007297 [Ramalina farinacea]|uniref:protein S-acyltransferase n=1 Tax=Ramalina farinacea TaxID=258253 RepID=A0AA43QK75_9LECA|nr:hypothetical protein [Ramalina farinacea]
MSLLELLKDAYSAHKNYEGRHFVPFEAARQIVTGKRVDDWSQSHPLCLEHGSTCPERNNLIRKILYRNIYVFVVLIFAELEFLTKGLLASGSKDAMLFDNGLFERYCISAELSAEQKQSLVKCRSYVAVKFSDRRSQDIPVDAVLPFLKRESLDKYGSFGVIYRVTIPAYHLQGFSHEGTLIILAQTIVAEKRIRPMTDPSQGDWQKLSREVETLKRRKDHPSIISLLASYTKETDESGHYVKMLHLLFPLAEMDLADWMNRSQIPLNIAEFSRQERQRFVYRSMLAVVSGVSYLHQEIDGMVTAHHDLKPRNILLVNGTLKIADLGHSHLRPLLQGSATEGASGLGTYEYQPPEYWNKYGSRANVRHGRQFDIWAMGCIILEMAILVVDDWQTNMVTQFRTQRKANQERDRKSPGSVQAVSDASFHNNLSVVKGWIDRLRAYHDSQQLNNVLDIVVGMLAPEPRNRLHAWEVELDLYETLKPLDHLVPDPEGDLCVPPRPIDVDEMELRLQWQELYDLTETPLHRAAKSNNRKRIIRLWELGWPIWFPDQGSGRNPDQGSGKGVTPQDIMKSSQNVEIRELERDSRQLIYYASDGNIEQVQELFRRGLGPLMADAHGNSALHEAIKFPNIDMVDFLLQSKAKEQLMLPERFRMDLTKYNLPLHIAAGVGFVAALERMMRYRLDINALNSSGKTPLYLATFGDHFGAVQLLLENKAQLLPSEHKRRITDTPLHAAVDHRTDYTARYTGTGRPESHTTAVRVDILNLLLEADGAPECLDRLDRQVTPLHLALQNGYVNLFNILLQRGASVHNVGHVDANKGNILYTVAKYDRPQILKLCIDRFSLKDFEVERPRVPSSTPLELAQKNGHREVARLMKKRIGELRGSAGDDSGSWRNFAILERLKRLFIS